MLARAGRDYYRVLGVSPDADREAIKKAFRARAAELHPDVSAEPDAEAQFRELVEAYEVLSRAESRARYDRLGTAPAGAGAARPRAGDARHLFADLFEHPAAAASRRTGADVVIQLEIGFQEAAKGTTRGIRYVGRAACPRCRGDAGACPECHGFGSVEEERAHLVRVPPGTGDGTRLRVPGAGHAGRRGASPGDLVVELRVAQPPDSPLLRRIALAGVVLGVGLLVAVLVVLA
jgi:DnaJ-class molecular chaperone